MKWTREKIDRVYRIFRKNYALVPLEVYKNDPYKTLISTLLSARTKDEVTYLASEKLFAKANNIFELAKLNVSEIERLIYPVGFYKTKAKNLKNLALKIINEHKGKIPSTKDKLVQLPGVGSKTANLVLNRVFAKPAIAVDTHVHKIANMLGWVNTKTPAQTEKALHEFIPKRYWSETNKLFVSIGRQYKTKNKILSFLKENSLIN
ncbi:MAG: endonuclease III [Patescibacteria group bacterium]|nr:endonuclease III [Patescibacteria group bacterium]